MEHMWIKSDNDVKYKASCVKDSKERRRISYFPPFAPSFALQLRKKHGKSCIVCAAQPVLLYR